MATFTFTYMPTYLVIKNGGSMNLKDLTSQLGTESQRHFPDLQSVERAITRYTACLKITNGDRVVFDREAKSYAKFGIMEREIDVLLHENLPDMARFELYPHKTQKNSPTCAMGVSWTEIPRDEDAAKRDIDPYGMCDFHGNGEEGCRIGCGVKVEVLRRLGFNV